MNDFEINKKCHNSGSDFKIENNILIGKELSIPKKSVNVAEEVLKLMKSKPDFIGQVNALTDKVHTYADMIERSIKCAVWLKKQGVKPGDIIGLCSDNNLDAFLVLLGTLYIGAICSTWEYVIFPITAQYFLQLTSPKIVFTMSASAANLRQAAKKLNMNLKVVTFDKSEGYESLEENVMRGHDAREIVEFKCFTTDPDHVAIIIPSSGTTGPPKGIEISHYSLYCSMHPDKNCDLYFQTCMTTSTLRWFYAILIAFKIIAAEGKQIIAPENDDIEIFCQFIEKYRITWFVTDPFMIIKLIKSELLNKYCLSSLRGISTSGAHFRKEYIVALREKLPNLYINNLYGMTDVACVCSAQTRTTKLGSVGYVLSDVCIKMVDLETEEVLGPNKIGELRIKTITMMQGYHKNPEMTKKAFDSDGWFRSCDLGYYDDDGEIYIVDRISDFISFRGIKISPAEVETILATHPAVLQAAMIGIPHEVDEQHPMALVLRVPGKSVTEEELISLVEKNMPDYYRLRGGVKFVDQLPRTSTGKIRRKQLREMYAN